MSAEHSELTPVLNCSAGHEVKVPGLDERTDSTFSAPCPLVAIQKSLAEKILKKENGSDPLFAISREGGDPEAEAVVNCFCTRCTNCRW